VIRSEIDMQMLMFGEELVRKVPCFKSQLLKWVGNKQRFAHEIVSYFPDDFDAYHEVFLGSGAVLGTLAPKKGFGSDCFKPLIEIWQTLQKSPAMVKEWYAARYACINQEGKKAVYDRVKASYNAKANGADLLFISRTCYGGVVRFRKADGYCSTPCGVHAPMPPAKFAQRVNEWHRRTQDTIFEHIDYMEAMQRAKSGDMVYCDPPYSDSQAILYGAQTFSLASLLKCIADCKQRRVYVALSIDGTKKTGDKICDLPIPTGLFEREVFVNCGRSMLRRFQMAGQTLEGEVVHDRLLLTY
jgi:DNA adenine methylase